MAAPPKLPVIPTGAGSGTGRPGITRVARRLGLDGATLVVLVGLALTSVLYFWARALDNQREEHAFRHHARLFGGSLQKRLDRSFELMQTVPALFSVKPEVTAQEFVRFVKLAGDFHAAIQWAPRVVEAERAEFEAGARALGLNDYEIREAKGSGLLVRSAVRATYLPILYCEPPNPEVIGFDLYSEATRRAYVQQTRDSGKPVITNRFELIEQQQPTAAIAVYQAVYSPGQPVATPAQRRDAFRGVVASVLVPADLLREGLAGMETGSLDIALRDDTASTDEHRLLYESSLGADVGVDASPVSASFPLRFGERRWRVSFAPGLGFTRLSPQYRFHVVIGGLGLTLVLALAYAFWRSRRVIKQASRAIEQLGQYEVLEEIGRGGMGVVYKARHSTLRRATAIKLLLSPSEKMKQRFEREARVTSRLRHPNTVAVYDYGRTPEGALYYAMEYVPGISLSELVKTEGPQAPGRVVHILGQIAGSLAEAHAEGLVHRDIKPSNIMLQSKGGVPDFVTVLDFGLVRDLSVGATLTGRHQMPVGTPAYMSPEQIKDEIVTESADLYALGGVAYYLLTGIDPFHAATAVEVCMGHLNRKPEAPSARLGRPLPAELEALVLSLLEKQVESRPESAREVCRRLDGLSGFEPWDRASAERWWSARGRSGAPDELVEESPYSGGRRTITVDFSSRG